MRRDVPVDSDHDGVFDGLDQCPNTPLGATVNAAAAPADTDGDGVLDGIDRCRATPTGVKVDVNGCPLAEVRDSDHDGVPDDRDKCPNTPPNTAVDQSGCIILFHEERVLRPRRAPPECAAARPTLILRACTSRPGGQC